MKLDADLAPTSAATDGRHAERGLCARRAERAGEGRSDRRALDKLMAKRCARRLRIARTRVPSPAKQKAPRQQSLHEDETLRTRLAQATVTGVSANRLGVLRSRMCRPAHAAVITRASCRARRWPVRSMPVIEGSGDRPVAAR